MDTEHNSTPANNTPGSRQVLQPRPHTHEVVRQRFVGERSLFMSRDLLVGNCVFEDGESPLKESRNIDVDQTIFRWKYPLWYCNDVQVTGSAFLEMSRSGIWYTNGIRMSGCTIEAPKEFRRCQGVTIEHCSFAHAAETLWSCSDISLTDVSATGDYFAMNSSQVRAHDFQLVGNYAFDGGRDIEISNARLLSKDAFWNCENVVIRDSFIVGEYLGWNSRNLVFENCAIESLQGLCYIDGLTMRNCTLVNTTLAFEYCQNIDAQIASHIDSVKNPLSGTISAASIGELIFDDPAVDRTKTRITPAGPQLLS